MVCSPITSIQFTFRAFMPGLSWFTARLIINKVSLYLDPAVDAVSLILGSVALVIISMVMLQSKIFSKTTAYLGILANVFAMGLCVPKTGTYILLFSVVFLWVWYILITRRFFQLGQGISKKKV